MNVRRRISVVASSVLVACLFFTSAAFAESVTFSQLDFDLNGKITDNSDWGVATLEFTGSQNVLYFNLQVNGVWVVQNVPVPSSGVGVSQSVDFWFDLGNATGADVTSLNYAYQLTPAPLVSAPGGSTVASVDAQDVTIHAGTPMAGEPSDPVPSGNMLGRAAVAVAQGFVGGLRTFVRGDVPNQEQGLCECAVTAFSNSLQWLNTRYNLGLQAGDISISKMKDVMWDASKGLPKDNFIDLKDAYMRPKGVTTRKYTATDILTVANMLNSGQDVEMWIWNPEYQVTKGATTTTVKANSHMVTVTGMIPLADGKWQIWFQDDGSQGKAGGLRRKPTTYDPNANQPWGTPPAKGAFTDGPLAGQAIWQFVVECPAGKVGQPVSTHPVTPEGQGKCSDCHVPGDTQHYWLDVPAGAVSGDTYVYFGNVPAATIPSPGAVPDGYDRVVKAVEFGPDGATFDAPMTMTLKYNEGELGHIAEASLDAFYYDETGGEWVPVPDAALDEVNNSVTFQTSHFSMYGLSGEEPQPTPASSPWALGALAVVGLGVVARRMRHKERVV